MANEPDSRYERDTWPEMKRLATEVPEAGIHFQSTTDLFAASRKQTKEYLPLTPFFRRGPPAPPRKGHGSGPRHRDARHLSLVQLPLRRLPRARRVRAAGRRRPGRRVHVGVHQPGALSRLAG